MITFVINVNLKEHIHSAGKRLTIRSGQALSVGEFDQGSMRPYCLRKHKIKQQSVKG